MLNFTPDLKPSSRRSIVGTMITTTAAASPLPPGSTKIRRRYSLAVDASLSVTVNGKTSEQTASSLGRSLSQPAAGGTPGVAKRMSMHENLMMKILATPVDQPLAEEDEGDSSSSETSFCSSLADAGTPISTEEKLLIESDVLLRCTTPPNIPLDCQNNPRLARLYKDLQSPSATTRLRALRALKSPSKREAYGQFDVPHEEQDIITAEERQMPRPRTIQEVMANVCIYVEVRSGTDNRSDGIRDHLVSLGAKVNDKLYKDTTHVIFKDGLLSTYQKAKKMNVPVVSILWIEACKRHLCLMNPDSYPISNAERYENPELFKKIRRQKSMQPRAEEVTGSGGKKRPPLKTGIPSDQQSSSSSAKTVISPPTKLPVLHRLRKDDGLERILNEFQADNQGTPEPQDDFDKLLAGPMKLLEKFRNSPIVSTAEKEDNVVTPEAPPKSIRKSLFNGSTEKERTPTRRRRSSSASNDGGSSNIGTRQRRKTMLFTPRITSVEEENESPAIPVAKPVRNRRKTMCVSASKENTPPKKRDTICSPKAMELCKANSADVQENIPPASSQKVRATIYSPSRMEQSSEKTEKAVQIEMANSRRTLGLSTTDNVIDSLGPRKTKTPELDAKDLDAFRINRRRTLYTPGVYDESDKKHVTPAEKSQTNRRRTLFNPAANSTAASNCTPTKANSSQRRKTLCTPSNSVDVPETPEQATPVVSHHRTTPFTTPLPVQTPKTSTAAMVTPGSTAQKRNKTLLEEYQSSLTFNSTKTPMSERRKTIFDISMDIIDQRLSQINKQSKQSESTKEQTPAQPIEAVLKSPPPSKPLSISRQTSLDTFYRKLSRSSEKSIKFKTSVDLRESDIPNATTLSRKRKLFNAQPSLSETPPPSSNGGSGASQESSTSLDNPSKKPKCTTTPAAAVARRRTLAPTPTLKSQAVKTTTAAASRRSSMFFSQPNKPTTATTSRPVMGTQARTMKALGLGAGLPTVSSQSTATMGKPQFQLATTNLHAAQHSFVKEVVAKLGGFTVSNNVTDRTTHLVSLESRRTINLLRALTRGLWIVSYEWIEQSHSTNRWLPEEQFELRNFSPAVQLCRSERQAFGPRYRIDLFADCGPFYVAQQCEVPHDQLRELIVTCKGKVIGDAAKARYVIVSSRKDVMAGNCSIESFCVSPLWVLDSISSNKLKKVYKYLVRN